MADEPFKRYLCLGCGFFYDEALGFPEHGIAPGTRWADIPTTGYAPTAARPSTSSRWSRCLTPPANPTAVAARPSLLTGEQP